MTDKQILEKAIAKAIEGGWNGETSCHSPLYRKHLSVKEMAADIGMIEGYSVEEIIFNREFAKALWGEVTASELVLNSGGLLNYKSHEKKTYKDGWRQHLQSMVIADDPIKYLGENL